MANNLSAMLAVLTARGRIVPRESVGVVQSINFQPGLQAVGKGQSVRVGIVPRASVTAFTPTFSPSDNDTTTTAKTLTLDQSAQAAFDWEDEEQRALDAGDAGVADYLAQQIQQCLRAMLAQEEAYFHGIAYKGASRAASLAGASAMITTLADANALARILDENGVADGNRSLVLSHVGVENLRNQVTLTNISSVPGGIADRLNMGVLAEISGFAVRKSSYLTAHTAGTGSGYLINSGGGLAAGTTTIPVDTGSGTLLAGDIVLIGGVKYVVATALSGGSFTIAEPGLVAAVADNATVTRQAAFTPILAMDRLAVSGAHRPALVSPGGIVEAVETLTDAESGMAFTMAQLGGYGKKKIALSCVYAGIAVNPEAIAVLQA